MNIVSRRNRKPSAPVEAIPFTNEKGHVINPGDPVVYVTMCTRRVHVSTGTFVGVRKTESWRGRIKTSVVLDANKTKSVPIDGEGNECGYTDAWRKNGYKSKNVPYIGRVSLQRNRVYPLNVTLTDAFK
jgi:hypothetical protein